MLRIVSAFILITGIGPEDFPELPADLCFVEDIRPAAAELTPYEECPDYTVLFLDTGERSRLPAKISRAHAKLLSEGFRRGLLVIIPTR